MAASSGLVAEPQEVFQWLKNLPLAPEYHPTLAEFQDPIAYIFKIEKEASKYGICKIVPPVLSAPKKAAIANLNTSLAATSNSPVPTFTTRQQQIGFCPRKPRPVQKPVWQSGENYTFQEFEAKAKSFEKSYLKKLSSKKTAFSPLEVETLYWKATVDKPFSVEYANDMPGSAFSVRKINGGKEINEGVTVGETEWNMREVSRAKGSLLRFMKEEIPGVTSPMVYIAMMFSWFAWHVEDHDLHSLNYLHLGAGKTWYGVPREAAVAFEEVVRDHGYGGEINPLVTFSVLGEKTTVMSPEVFISAGVPCCRLVQNAGEFVVTFPRAYHSGFSHGFNCGEAANIATPEWLMVAKDAAIRRASINYPPMVSHFQLLYELALELCTRMPVSIGAKPRSSRLKDKLKDDGETLVKEQFMRNVFHNNELLHVLGKGTSVVLLPQNSSDISVCSNLRVGSQLRVNPALGLCNNRRVMKSSEKLVVDDTMLERNHGVDQVKCILSLKEKFASLYGRNRFSLMNGNDREHISSEGQVATDDDKLSDQRLFSCVTCGILSFDCVAVIRPTDTAARYLSSADCSFFNDWIVGSGTTNSKLATAGGNTNTSEQDQPTGWVENNAVDSLYDVPVQSLNHQVQKMDQNEGASNAKAQRESSALGLLALNYGNSSDSGEDEDKPDVAHGADENLTCSSECKYRHQNPGLPSFNQELHDNVTVSHTPSVARHNHRDKVSLQTDDFHAKHENGYRPGSFKAGSDGTLDRLAETANLAHADRNDLEYRFRDPASMSHLNSNCSPVVHDMETLKFSRVGVPRGNLDASFAQRSDEDSSRMHIFCLDHAVEVEQQFRSIGGVDVLLLCHPEYPRLEAEAKLLCVELGIDHLWDDIAFRDASNTDVENIQSALDSEEGIPGNGDWTVKLGINLFYSASLSRSSLYSKQMPYNSVIYKAFGRMSPTSSPTKLKVYGRSGKQKKVVAGRWCGKVWMSNQVHPFLLKRDTEDGDQGQEQDGSGWKMADERNERKPQSFHRSAATSTAIKFARKRKMAVASRAVNKMKSSQTENAASDDLKKNVSHKQHTKVYCRKQTKCTEREGSYDSLNDFHQEHEKIRLSRQLKSIVREDGDSDDSLRSNTLKRRRRILRSKQVKSIKNESDALAGNKSYRIHSRIPRTRSKRAKYIHRTSELSDDSLVGDIHRWHGRIPSTQAGFSEMEEAVSDDSLEESSHRPVDVFCRSRRPGFFDVEDAISDDSVENCSLQQNRRTEGSKAEYFERESEHSDDMSGENAYRKQTGPHRSSKNKFVDREGGISDEPLEENPHQQPLRTLKNKQDRFVGRGDEVSDKSLENFRRQQQLRRGKTSTCKKAKFVQCEDAISDDLDNGTCLKHWKTPRGKKARVTESEDLSDDSEDDAEWQHKRTPKGKPIKFIEKEDASDLEDETHRQQRKTFRHKQAASFGREDVSDDLQEEETSWRPRKTSRGKKTNSSEEEDASDDLQEHDTGWQPSKTPRGKQAKFVYSEDAVSDDLLESHSTKQQRKVPRSKQKSGTLHEMKNENLRRVKQGSSRSKRRENSMSIKQKKEAKQEIHRLRNSKREEHNKELEGGPSTRLRKRSSEPSKESEVKVKEKPQSNKKRQNGVSAVTRQANQKTAKSKEVDAEYQCDIEGCTMSFGSKQELAVHKRNICPVKGCGKTFFSHKYLVQHRRVHLDDRPLKCPWKGCKMTFKWAWARTEHIRVHTGARPYVCAEEGCGQTFRFVSDFSRHKRKTGHSVKKSKN